jgi:hypothetical protein
VRWVRVAPGQYALVDGFELRSALILRDTWAPGWVWFVLQVCEGNWSHTLKDAKAAAKAAVARRKGTG